MGTHAPVVVVAVDFVELDPLAVGAHTTAALANWSHSPSKTSVRRLQREIP